MTRRNQLGHIQSARTVQRPAVANRPRQRNIARANIAQLAARLIAEGLTDYHLAKVKAARQVGVTDHHALPDNHEIELALRAYYALFARETQPRALLTMRKTAILAMRQLEQFSPWLVGAVLNGTANEFSVIELELVGTGPKDFEMYLLNEGIVFEIGETGPPMGALPNRRRGPTARYHMDFKGTQVTIAMYECHAARQAAHSHCAIGHQRAQRADAERLFGDATHDPR